MKDLMQPDDPAVERAVREQLDALRPHVLFVTDDEVGLTDEGFRMLYEYSTSIPTGQADGKVWKSKTHPNAPWVMREMVDKGNPSEIDIVTRRIRIAV